MMTSNHCGLNILQNKVRNLISQRFIFTILLVSFNLAYHVHLNKSDFTNINLIFTEFYNSYIDRKRRLTRRKFKSFMDRILTLRSIYGGYYDSIFVDYTELPLVDSNKYWKLFFETTFQCIKISPLKLKKVLPSFTNDNENEDNIRQKISYEWQNEKVNGYFKEDPLGIIPCFSIFKISIDSFSNTETKMWYRYNPNNLFIERGLNTNKVEELYKSDYENFKKTSESAISELTKEYVNSNVKKKHLLIYFFGKGDEKHQFIAMLLYMILCKESIDNGINVLHKLPIDIRTLLEKRCEVTDDKLSEYSVDSDDKTYEMRICLMNTPDSVKRKAIEKLKEIQNKMSDISKPQQYLDKLLCIPFNIYKREAIFDVLKIFLNRVIEYSTNLGVEFVPKSWYDLNKFFNINNEIILLYKTSEENIVPLIRACKKVLDLKSLNYYKDEKKHTVTFKNKSINTVTLELLEYIKNSSPEVQQCISNVIRTLLGENNLYCNFAREWPKIVNAIQCNQKYVKDLLETSIYGQENAKNAIENIICEWITGRNEGYCFGFDGPPGVGKTTLARNGLSQCLIDCNGKNRPFIFIALGGMSHGSTLEGYGYTYASATCGYIVNALIQSKCMNPIIFFDELDKVSKTEHGQEIIGILMHLTDPSQNSEFRDKYFDGVSFDLSKALFIFSYNDVTKIDPILRDRIHSINFTSFSTQDKIHICNNFLIPSITSRLGMPDNAIILSDETLTYIIDNYTHESGVRKIKQIIIHIYREINTQLLGNKESIPIILNPDNIKNFYLKALPLKYTKRVPIEPQIGLVNGLFAMTCGGGGIIQISAQTVANIHNSNNSNFVVTGQLGDVMKESVKVAKTAVLNIINNDTYENHCKFVSVKNIYHHIHCSENGVPKDGPSAGLALFIVIMSSIVKIPIRNDVAFTGEIDLLGNIGIIGGLSDKLRGAYLAGVKTVFCPSENKFDIEKMDMEKETWMNEIDIKFISSVFDEHFLDSVFVDPVHHFITRRRSISFS